MEKELLRNKIRGSLVGGAVGDAVGYAVEILIGKALRLILPKFIADLDEI